MLYNKRSSLWLLICFSWVPMLLTSIHAAVPNTRRNMNSNFSMGRSSLVMPEAFLSGTASPQKTGIESDDFYKRLGLSDTATLKEIKKQAIILKTKYHSDRYVKARKQVMEENERYFKLIEEASSVLLDENKKDAYDKVLKGDYDEDIKQHMAREIQATRVDIRNPRKEATNRFSKMNLREKWAQYNKMKVAAKTDQNLKGIMTKFRDLFNQKKLLDKEGKGFFGYAMIMALFSK